MKIAWDQEMRREGVKYFSGNYTDNHPPTLLKDKDAAVVAQFTEALAPDIRALFDVAAADAVQPDPENGPEEEPSDDPLLDLLFENYFKTVFSGMNEALDAKAEELGTTTEDISAEASASAMDQWRTK